MINNILCNRAWLILFTLLLRPASHYILELNFSHSLLPIVVKFVIDVPGTEVERGIWEMSFLPSYQKKGRLWVFFGVTVKRLDMFFRLITGKIKILKRLKKIFWYLACLTRLNWYSFLFYLQFQIVCPPPPQSYRPHLAKPSFKSYDIGLMFQFMDLSFLEKLVINCARGIDLVPIYTMGIDRRNWKIWGFSY